MLAASAEEVDAISTAKKGQIGVLVKHVFFLQTANELAIPYVSQFSRMGSRVRSKCFSVHLETGCGGRVGVLQTEEMNDIDAVECFLAEPTIRTRLSAYRTGFCVGVFGKTIAVIFAHLVM